MPRSNYITHETLNFLMRGESWAFQQVARVLHNGMVNALRDGDGWIHAPWVEIARWAGISVRSIRRVVIRLREKGWLKAASGRRVALVFGRVPSPNSAKVAPSIYIKENHPGMDVKHPIPAQVEACAEVVPPAGEDELPQKPGRATEASPEPSVMGSVIAALVVAGADRDGAAVAAKVARKEGRLSLEHVEAIIAAVDALPSKPYRRGGLLCAAVRRPELGRQLVRDAEWLAKRSGKPSDRPHSAARVTAAPVVTVETPLNTWDRTLLKMKAWADVYVENKAELADLMQSFNVEKGDVLRAVALRQVPSEWKAWLEVGDN